MWARRTHWAKSACGGKVSFAPPGRGLDRRPRKKKKSSDSCSTGGGPMPPPGAPLADEDPGWVDEDGGSSTTGNLNLIFD